MESPFILFAILSLVVAIGVWMETDQRYNQFGTVFVLCAPMGLSALSVIPHSSPVYGFVSTYFVPLAIPLLLFSSNIRAILQQAGPMLGAFGLAIFVTLAVSVTTMFGLGFDQEAKVWASILTSGFIGGAANIASVADAFDRSQSPELAVVVTCGLAVAIPYLAFLFLLPSIKPLWRLFSAIEYRADHHESPSDRAMQPEVSSLSLIFSLTCSVVIVAVADVVVSVSGQGAWRYIVITALSVFVASALPDSDRRLAGHFSLGHVLIYLFFAALGAQVNFALISGLGLQIVLFAVILLTMHLICLSLLGRILKVPGAMLLIASNASIFGPPTAAAMAASKGWGDLVTPGLLCGVLGYATANFFGIFLTMWILQ